MSVLGDRLRSQDVKSAADLGDKKNIRSLDALLIDPDGISISASVSEIVKRILKR